MSIGCSCADVTNQFDKDSNRNNLGRLIFSLQASQGGLLIPRADDEMDIQISPQATARIDYEFVCKLIVAIVRKQRTEGHLDASARSRAPRKDGAVLVFCPGKGEISALSRVLLEHPVVGDRSVCNVLKLHSTVSSADQRLVFRQASAGIVKIVLATNVAETSITISDVSSVIDTGRVKESRFNASSRIRELVTVWTSKASATQRAGRSGRTGPGVCWRLYSKEFFNDKMPARTSPEIMRTPLDELVLQCCLEPICALQCGKRAWKFVANVWK